MSFELILPFFRPIEALLLDDTVSEIMGNPDGVWWIETRGQLARAEGVQFDPKALIAGLEVIANYLGKKLGEDTPSLNAQLPDGSRLAAALPPVVRPGPAVTIRKFRQKRYTIEELIEAGSLTEEMANFLQVQVRDGKTLLISGGTGSGKTTLLNALVDFIPQSERIRNSAVSSMTADDSKIPGVPRVRSACPSCHHVEEGYPKGVNLQRLTVPVRPAARS
jgi:pilus assembly protein CpaF